MHNELLWRAIQGYRFREETSVDTRCRARGFVGKVCAVSGKVKSKYKERRKERNKVRIKEGDLCHEIMPE